MRTPHRPALLLLLLLLLPFARAETAGPDPHTPGGAADCGACHAGVPPAAAIPENSAAVLPDPAAFRADGTAMCTSCHGEAESHVVGATIDFPVPADLPLGPDKTITCSSCHHAHGSLASDRPRASYSFMDRLSNSPRLHKSYLLRRSNVNGELCLVCHDQSK